jgi:hypothetical protein
MVHAGRDEPPRMPDGATAVPALELMTHERHVTGRGLNRLLLYEQAGQAFLRAAGTWDEMALTLEGAYRRIGRRAQSTFWGPRESSMLVQIAQHAASR